MTGRFRTALGGAVDRATPILFTFDGEPYEGLTGDTLASALLSHGVHLAGRSFKYHRPRGFLGAGSEEPNALASVARDAARVTPNLRMTQVEIYGGLAATSQNRWPRLGFDLGAINGLFAPLLVAGFYYKTFMGPRFIRGAKVWADLFEPIIRRAAGLGESPTLPDPDRYANRYAHCEVLVVGAGPAGLAAALSAARAGSRVILCDEGARMGGSLLASPEVSIEGVPAAAWVAAALEELEAAGVRLLPRTQAFGYYNHNLVGLCERLTDHLEVAAPAPRERMWQVRAGHVVLAAGATERPLVFPDNDRPGIMLADAARVFLHRYGVKAGSRAVVITAHDSAYRTAFDLVDAGVTVARIVDVRPRPPAALLEAAQAHGIAVSVGSTIVETKGAMRVSRVTVAKIAGAHVIDFERLSCDLVLMCGGWTAAVHLFSQSRGKLRFDAATQTFVPGAPAQAQASAGGCTGAWGIAAALAEGEAAGRAATQASGESVRYAVQGDHAGEAGGFAGALPHGRDPASVKAFVDFQNDVTAKDIALAVREGFRSIEHVKRYTTSGMATDQGKTSNINALAIAAAAQGRSVPEVGLTTFRQPYTPVTFGAFAGFSRGDLFDPIRETPTHAWALAHGARFEDVGQWKRAHYFPVAGEDMHAAVARECRVTRATAGLFDGSTLGKIEVVGPDAAEFLNRLYTNSWSKLGVGRCRYGLMLTESGFVMDDGVVGRLAPDRFHVTTTTGGAPRVLNHMEDYLQTEFPELNVWLTSVTEQWAVIAVQGPRARDIIAPLVEGIDLSAAAMPHMSLREGTVCGVPTRLFRVSFTGELGFEINVPADYGRAVWEAVWARARPLGAVVYGTEAMHVLRAEKGYVIVGQETDGTVTPDDLGMGWAVASSKPDFVGKRSLDRPDLVASGRKQLVGLSLVGDRPLEEGAQIVALADPPRGTHAIGHVTSSYWSPATGGPIALALVESGRSRIGETLFVPMPDGAVAVTIRSPVFYDSEGARLDG